MEVSTETAMDIEYAAEASPTVCFGSASPVFCLRQDLEPPRIAHGLSDHGRTHHAANSLKQSRMPFLFGQG